jgi:hypothetical protein
MRSPVIAVIGQTGVAGVERLRVGYATASPSCHPIRHKSRYGALGRFGN